MPAILPWIERQISDAAGLPISGAKIYPFAANTTTPKVTYQDALGLTPNTHPILTDAAGRFKCFLAAGSYDFQVNNAADVPLYTLEDISSSGVGGSETLGVVATLAALKALSGGAFESVNVLGHTAEGDGGGGSFLWVSSSTAADDNGIVISPNSAPGNGRWIRDYSGAINVKWYGTSDHVALGRAHAAAVAAGGGTILIPVGGYAIGANLTLGSTRVSVQALPGALLTIASGFTLTLSGTLTADLSQLFAGLGTVVGNKRITGVNPYWFGAVADKSNDDLAAIQAAIRLAATCDRVLNLPPGDYGISNTLDLKALLGISDVSIYQGFFTIRGENPKTCRIIPTANVAEGMISCVNAGTGNAANARQLRFENFSLYSDAVLNKSFDYGFHLKWCAEVYYENVNIINCCNIRLVYHDTTFVCDFLNCDFIGKANEVTDPGSGGAPDGPSNAMNTPPVSYDTRLTALYFANTSTTTKVDSCRMNSCRIGVNHSNGDMFEYHNNAIESNADYGFYLPGSTSNININANYWEGNGGNIYVTARADNLRIVGNFLHGSAYGLRVSLAFLNCLEVRDNFFFSSTNGIIFDDPNTTSAEIKGNYFDIDSDEFVYGADEFDSYGSQGYRIDWSNNYTANNANARRFFRESKNLNQVDFQDWSSSGGALTRASSTKKSKVANTYQITAPTQSDFLYSEIAGIAAGQNKNLAGSWITVLLPMYFDSIASYLDTGVTFSNSAGDLLCTHATDFPDGSTVQFSGGVMPGGIAANTSYQLVRITATTCKLTAGAGNIPYSTPGSGATTMVYYQSGGKLRIDDGTVQHDYLLNISELTVWKTARAYFKVADGANTLTIRLYPNGANFTVENMVVLKGLWGDSEILPDFHGQLYVHPPLQSSKSPIRLYQGPTNDIVIAALDNPGSPSYGALYLYDQTGAKTVELNGGPGALKLKMGAGQRLNFGNVLVAGTVTVANTAVTANTLFSWNRVAPGGTLGHIFITRNPGVGYTITSSSNTETSTIDVFLVEGF